MNTLFEASDSSKFNRVLLLVVRFGKLIADAKFAVEFNDSITFLFHGIVAAESTRGTMFSDEVLIAFGKVTFAMDTIASNV